MYRAGRVIIKFGVYLSPMLILLAFLEYHLSKIENSYTYKIKNFTQALPDVELLVLGNSQALKGINPQLISKNGFNMANVSQTLPVDEAILETYIDKMPKLKTVLIGISYTSFGESLEEGQEEWRLSFYQKYYRFKKNIRPPWKSKSHILMYTPYESLKMALKNFRMNLIAHYQSNGWMKVEKNDAEKLSDMWAMRRAESHTNSLSSDRIELNTSALRKMLIRLRKYGIHPILVCTPVMKNYALHLDKKWEETNEKIVQNMISDGYTGSIDFNKSDIADCIDCFADVDHLNKKGALYISTQLGEVVNKDTKKTLR